jgi:hypothetical protein
MNTTTPISPLRRRMIEDMTVRGFGEKTQSDYDRARGGSGCQRARHSGGTAGLVGGADAPSGRYELHTARRRHRG